MAASDLGRLVRRSLDPVLVPAGFQEGQGGDDGEGSAQVIFCTGYDEFNRRYSGLPQANQQEESAICVDLVVDVRCDGTLDRLDLEGISVAETLLQAGLVADSEAVSQLRGRSVADSLPVIEVALRRLFGSD
jgi:hypothetical protein